MAERPARLLAFDTSGAHCAAALLSGGSLAVRVDPMARGQAEHLMPMLEEMLGAAGLSWRDLDGIGVCTGPGNFTGIRIAVSAARGLALGLGKPAIGVSRFEAMAEGLPRPVMALVPAPREQAYVQTFRETGADVPRLLDLADLPRDLPEAPHLDAEDLIDRVARIAATRLGTGQPRPAPLYVRGADAAPPRDPAPVLLP